MQVLTSDDHRWIADSSSRGCMRCSSRFTMCNRRHHCRFCGRLLCRTCSNREVVANRACEECFHKYKGSNVIVKGGSTLSLPINLSPRVHGKMHMLSTSPLINHSAKTMETLHGSPALEERDLVRPTRAGSFSVDCEPDPSRGSVYEEPALTAPSSVGPNPVAIVVDPFSTGAICVQQCLQRGYQVLRVYSAVFPKHIMDLTLEGVRLEYVGTVQHSGDIHSTLKDIKKRKLNLVGLICGCETGVEVADVIAEALQLRGNILQTPEGDLLSECRRDKYLMGERIRKCGVRAVAQIRAVNWDEISAFLETYNKEHEKMKLVIKPLASAGSDHVYVCKKDQEVKEHFAEIVGGVNMLGNINSSVVLQDFMEGKEYVVDTCSLDGQVKVITIWEYDKRICNGADFVYFAMRLVSGDTERAQELITYVKEVLPALGIVNGPGHAEIMYTPQGPTLVEVGARPHGGEGSWVPLVTKCLGYNQVEATISVLLGDFKPFEELPDYPTLTDTYGMECFLVSREEGVLKALPLLSEVRKLKSFFQLDLLVKPGDKIVKTIDCITRPGSIRLMHKDKKQVEKDFDTIREMELNGFYVVEPEGKEEKEEKEFAK